VYPEPFFLASPNLEDEILLRVVVCNIPDFRFGNFIMSFICICTTTYFSKLKKFCFGQKLDYVMICIFYLSVAQLH
jgi:hypothetical protein